MLEEQPDIHQLWHAKRLAALEVFLCLVEKRKLVKAEKEEVEAQHVEAQHVEAQHVEAQHEEAGNGEIEAGNGEIEAGNGEIEAQHVAVEKTTIKKHTSIKSIICVVVVAVYNPIQTNHMAPATLQGVFI